MGLGGNSRRKTALFTIVHMYILPGGRSIILQNGFGPLYGGLRSGLSGRRGGCSRGLKTSFHPMGIMFPVSLTRPSHTDRYGGKNRR